MRLARTICELEQKILAPDFAHADVQSERLSNNVLAQTRSLLPSDHLRLASQPVVLIALIGWVLKVASTGWTFCKLPDLRQRFHPISLVWLVAIRGGSGPISVYGSRRRLRIALKVA